MSKKVLAEIEAATRNILDERLQKLTDIQRESFHARFFPFGAKANDLVAAIDICDRTIEKNEEPK